MAASKKRMAKLSKLDYKLFVKEVCHAPHDKKLNTEHLAKEAVTNENAELAAKAFIFLMRAKVEGANIDLFPVWQNILQRKDNYTFVSRFGFFYNQIAGANSAKAKEFQPLYEELVKFS